MVREAGWDQGCKPAASFDPNDSEPITQETPEQVKLGTTRRGDIYSVRAQLKHVTENPEVSRADPDKAAALRKGLGAPAHYAPRWVRMLSAFCLSAGTMVAYKRVVRTLSEKFAQSHMAPGPDLSAELMDSVLIGTAGPTDLPVTTTHIITSGIAGS